VDLGATALVELGIFRIEIVFFLGRKKVGGNSSRVLFFSFGPLIAVMLS
jgi:hypothetical protein